MDNLQTRLKKATVYDAGRYYNPPTLSSINKQWNFKQNPKELLISAGARRDTMFTTGELPISSNDHIGKNIRFPLRDLKSTDWIHIPGPHPLPPRESFSYDTQTERHLRNNVFSDGFPRSNTFAEKKIDDKDATDARIERLQNEYNILLDKSKSARDPNLVGAYRTQAEEIKDVIDRLKSNRTQEELLAEISKNISQMNLKLTPEGAISMMEGVKTTQQYSDAGALQRPERLNELNALNLSGGKLKYSIVQRVVDGKPQKDQEEVDVPEGMSRIKFLQQLLQNQIEARVVQMEELGKKQQAEVMKEVGDLINAGRINKDEVKRGLEQVISNRNLVNQIAIAVEASRQRTLDALNLEEGDLVELFSRGASREGSRRASLIGSPVEDEEKKAVSAGELANKLIQADNQLLSPTTVKTNLVDIYANALQSEIQSGIYTENEANKMLESLTKAITENDDDWARDVYRATLYEKNMSIPDLIKTINMAMNMQPPSSPSSQLSLASMTTEDSASTILDEAFRNQKEFNYFADKNTYMTQFYEFAKEILNAKLPENPEQRDIKLQLAELKLIMMFNTGKPTGNRDDTKADAIKYKKLMYAIQHMVAIGEKPSEEFFNTVVKQEFKKVGDLDSAATKFKGVNKDMWTRKEAKLRADFGLL